MEASKGSIQYDPNGIQDRFLICQSSRKLKPSYKKYIGVQKCKSGRFYAFISDPITKKRRSLGTYDTAEQAASAYDFAAEVMRGTKAKTNLITFNPFKLTPSGAPTLSSSAAFSPPFSSKHSNHSSSPLNKPFNPSFLSKPSNPDNPFSSSLLNKPSQKQDNQVLHFGGSSTMLSSPWHKFRVTNQDIYASEHPLSTNDFTVPCSVPYTQSFQVPSSPMASTLNESTSAVPETISTTQSLPNPVFPSIHRFLPNVDELAFKPQSQQCSTTTPSPCTTIPCTSIRSTSDLFNLDMENHSSTGLLNLDMQKGLYVNKNEQQWSQQYDVEKELNSTQLPGLCEWSTDSQLCSILQSQQCSTTIHNTIGLSNLDMQMGLYENQKEEECIKQYDIEELSSTQLAGLCEWLTDSQLCDIPQSQQCTTTMLSSIHPILPCSVPYTQSTNDFTLPCSVPYTQSFQNPSSPMASTLNKSTSAVPDTISTTQSLPNPVFPSIHRFLPNVNELASTDSQLCSLPQSPQCNTVSQCTTGLSNLNMQNGQQCTQQDDLEKLLQYGLEELSSTQSDMPSNADLLLDDIPDVTFTDLCKWSTELLDFLLEDIPDVSTLPSLEGILD